MTLETLETLKSLALFCIGVGLAHLSAGVFIRFFEGRYDDDDADDRIDQPSEGEHESTDFFGYIITSVGVLLYIAYRIFQAG